MVFASTEKLPALVKPLEMLKGRVRTVIVWGAGDADAAAVRALSVACTSCAGRGARHVLEKARGRGLLSGACVLGPAAVRAPLACLPSPVQGCQC